MRAWALALVFGGCSFQAAPSGSFPGGSGGDDVVPIDAPTDGASLEGVVPPVCLGTFINVCVDPPKSAVTLSKSIDTATSDQCAPYTATPAIDACVVTGKSINVTATIAVTGNKPLIVFSTDGITISGVLDAASHQGGARGPAADAGPCPSTGFINPTTNFQGGGGWGGSFGTAGGNGGNGAGGTGGMAAAAFTTTALRGGCPGSDGASNGLGGGRGGRGRGGGAVLLLAARNVAIDGTVNASGAGGSGADAGAGGGGGGSGGMIVIEAATASVAGRCFANGGGGGEGGSAVGGNNGRDSSAPSSVAGGGKDGSLTAGDGGAGAFGTTQSLPGGNGGLNPPLDNGGGGAGGGGAGVIRIIAPEQHNTDDPMRVAPLPS